MSWLTACILGRYKPTRLTALLIEVGDTGPASRRTFCPEWGLVLHFKGRGRGDGARRAPLSADRQDDPWEVVANRDWQVVTGSYGTTPYRPEDVKEWKWTFAGMMRKIDMSWQSPPPKDFPSRQPFTTAVFFHERRPGEGLWQIDLTNSPFKSGQGKTGAFTLRRVGSDWVLKVRLSTDDGQFGPPDSVEGQKDGYLTIELRSPAQ
jgi:hypothetical protein